MTIHKLTLACLGAVLSVGAAPAVGAPFYYVSSVIAPDGSVPIPSPSFTVTHPKTGKYQIQFTEAYKPYVNCLANSFASNARLAGLFIHKKSCTLLFEDIASGKPEDTYVSFIAVTISH